MYIESVPNRNSPPAILLRESYREGAKVKKRTLTNLSKWPPHIIEGLRQLLKGAVVVGKLEEAFDVVRSQPHGHVAAILGFLRRLRVDEIIGGGGCREHALALALIVARIIDPRSKLATARGLGEETGWSSLWGLAWLTKMTSTLPWIGCWPGRLRSKKAWLGDI
jgi:hypothetical protein